MARFQLRKRSGRQVLIDCHFPNQQPLYIDFTAGKLIHRIRRGGKKELLLRAVGAKPGLRVSDFTAGLGTDSFMLAAAGCEVTMYERSPVLGILLQQALQQAARVKELMAITERMHLVTSDPRRSPDPITADVIYLDPMFPSRTKSALVNGPMQYLQRFLGPDVDADSLVQFAQTRQVKRVVVKRPTGAAADNATFELSARVNRFDVYEQPEAGCN